MTEAEFLSGHMGGKETSRLLYLTEDYCKGHGVDMGCELDPHPNAHTLVDNGSIVWDMLHETHEVHIRNIEDLFPDWEDERYDFVYHSHLIEHIRDPKAFLQECLRIVKPGGNVVVIGPHEDWYWPCGHPDANPDHSKYNWSLNQDRVAKWFESLGNCEVIHKSEHGWSEDNWSFVVVAKKAFVVVTKKA